MKVVHDISPAIWIDLTNPTREEIKSLLEDKKIPVSLVDELVSPSEHPMALMADGVLFTVLHFPKSHKESDDLIEIDFVIGQDYVITAHYEHVQTLEHFRKLVEVESITDHTNLTAANGPLLFSAIIARLYENIFDELEVIESEVKSIEDKIFAGDEKNMVFKLSKISRALLNFRKGLDPHERTLHQMTELAEKKFGEIYKISILGSFDKVKSVLRSESDIVRESQDTNLALLETKQNEIMKTLTTVIFLTTPAMLIAAIFTIPAKHVPILESQNDFGVLMVGTFFISFILFVFVKFKKWI